MSTWASAQVSGWGECMCENMGECSMGDCSMGECMGECIG